MIDIDKWREIFSSLQRHKLRTFLTAFSVWWGIFMLVILLGAGSGMENAVKRNFQDDAINSIYVQRGQTSKAYKGLPAGRFIQFRNDDFEAISDLDKVAHSTGRYWLNGQFFVRYKNESIAYNVLSVHPGHAVTENTLMMQGRYINEKDINEFRKVCVIGNEVKEGFFKDEDPIGKSINVKGVDFKVVGVSTDARSDYHRRVVYLPLTTAQKIDGNDRVHEMIVELGDATFEESKVVEENIRATLATRLKFSPEDREAVDIFNLAEEFQDFTLIFGFIKGFIWFVGIGSIVAGVIGVSNIMLIIVKERTKEIGVRKALGATPRSIVAMIVQESIFLTSVAGYLGLVAGLAVVFGVQSFMEANEIEADFFYNPEVNLGMVITAVVVLILSGTISGLIPALQAVKINPVVAMKS
ncbi:MAG: ABC transporter permease [Bacteroidota bacterium]